METGQIGIPFPDRVPVKQKDKPDKYQKYCKHCENCFEHTYRPDWVYCKVKAETIRH